MRKLSRANPTLHLFSGEDREIISKLNHPKINRNFNIIGFFVMVICAVCFVSALVFSYNILSGVGKIGSIPIGIFWGFAVTIIYLLLLYTISPPLLVDKKMFKAKTQGVEKSKKKLLFFIENSKNFWNWLTFSMILRIFFITLFALVTVQPFIVMLFSPLVQDDLDLYKSHYKSEIILVTDQSKIEKENQIVADYLAKNHIAALSQTDSLEFSKNIQPILAKLKLDQDYLAQSLSLKSLIKNPKIKRKNKEGYIVQLNQLMDSEIASDELYLSENEISIGYEKFGFQNFKKEFDAVIQEKAENNSQIAKLIDGNPFYIRRIILISSLIPAAKLMNLGALAVFLLPIFLKFQIRKIKPKTKDQSFYYFKKEKEMQLVNESYRNFKRNFEANFQKRHHRSFIRINENLRPHLEKLKEKKPDCAKEIEKETVARFYPYINLTEQELLIKYNFTTEERVSLEEKNQVKFYEKYEDAPFNLILRENKIVELSGQSLINEVWGDE